MEQLKIFDFVVVGGGIAGISAIEQVCDVYKTKKKALR
jgi:hypothetical protein